MKIAKTTWLMILVLLTVVGLGLWNIATGDNTSDSQETSQTTVEPGAVEVSQDGQSIKYTGVVGESPLVTLKALTDVRTQTSDFGEYVTGIGEVDANDSNFWSFYVNGQQATVGADSYQVQGGDQIEWRLETIEL